MENWAELRAEFKQEHGIDLEDTLLGETPSGGLHVRNYLADGHRIGSTTGRLAEGINIPAEGGYVLIRAVGDRRSGVLRSAGAWPGPSAPDPAATC